jgi:hypothetical protein
LHAGARVIRRLAFCLGAGLVWSCWVGRLAAADPEPTPWSLRPLGRPGVPEVPGRLARGIRNPVDRFIRARLVEAGLEPAPEADRRTLLRRVCFDLTGLPPTPADLEAFMADRDPDAYERWVDRLLESPRYGERWARHWLDVVHFGETHGYDKDKPRPNAWPYRDYVIRALNGDKPYSRFVQEQLAGDVLFPGTRDGIEALGFIAAGPWDFIGHEEVPETKIDGKVARHLDRDDMVVNTIQTFNSLTVQCAQCHNHKFDPVTQEDYYGLQAVFAAVDRTNRRYDVDPQVARERAGIESRRKTLESRRRETQELIRARAGEELKDLEARVAALEKASVKGDAFGYHSNIEKKPDTTKWVQVDLGAPVALSSVVLHPGRDDFNGIGEGFGFPVRFKVELSDDGEFQAGVRTIGDQTGKDVPNPGIKAQSFEAHGQSARYVRVTATRLAPRQNDYIFALAELEALTSSGGNAAAGRPVSALDSIEAPVRWQKSNLTDGYYPGAAPGGGSAELAGLRKSRDLLVERNTQPAEKALLEQTDRELAEVKEAAGRLPAQSVAYVGAVHTGSGAFAGTGGAGGKPRAIHVLNRGNVLKPGPEVGPGAIASVASAGGLPARFELAADQPEGERRAALARWLTAPSNPLTWRSIVNRVWQYHFGHGIVDTPNDFGRMGATPTHPELLDWLAVEFRDGGQSLKKLHRLLVTSATYRQSSAVVGNTDSENRYLARMTRRKLDAEAVRDSLLAVSGQLDLTMGGASFQDFVVDKPEHSPHYEYRLHDPEDPKSHRRSVYRFIVRSQQQPFMTALDCADPSMQVGRRNESVSPLQALAMLNNPLVLSLSKHFAARLDAEGGDLATRVRRGYYEALGHPPSGPDLAAMTRYAEQHGLENLCRVLFNLNEFAFVD